ncbi:aromatic hydrocarbon degradation protein [Flavobacterium sp. F-380]|uniref:Aromatic hydrocarbon degradation protein n=1 Tax=Flavobacterium kayseriense TaxID=2764714 RepID=A0ABR7J3J9_9FLAO|nr:aromatic hydrocarbon degradation protein [Flavobacterium kayseriense]MBC5840085.1 aromatic hydrocarbon degradation protein [Flavobacterium kayseriense]MBC5847245.1 aromatic hydrocarbon degradation protein [Flavobacterium kayseriense]MBU0941806.1 aromatic hydrocarbon degradation protein [Bacteroidota bacterium]
MKNKIALTFILIILVSNVYSQSISSSPYSIYGLGSLYDSNFGSNASIGSSGIALPSSSYINNLNPASLGFMYTNHFLFDIGGQAIQTSYSNGAKTENRNNMQFSHIAMAFPVSTKAAFSVALKPYSSATYTISNLELPIENSTESYTINASGSGGLNDFSLSYGYKLGKKFSVGLASDFLFGTITDNRDYTIANSITSIDKTSYYKGARLSLGTQVKVDSTFMVGATIKSPSQIKASKIQSVIGYNIATSTSATIETDASYDVVDYYMPLEIGVGVSKVFKNNLNFTMDYTKSLWNSTNQSSLYGTYVNQDRIAAGFSYFKTKSVRTYFDRMKYATGFNYDTGYLEIDNKRINNVYFSVGVSLPLEGRTFSALNLTYSYGQKGSISSGLIKENYHKLSVNLSLDGIWFVKRKYE